MQTLASSHAVVYFWIGRNGRSGAWCGPGVTVGLTPWGRWPDAGVGLSMDRKDRTMHPRMLARDGCSGGTCPAVYDLDDLPDDLVIQGKKVSADLLGRLTGVADDETAVTIPREVVRKALRPAAVPVGLHELQAQFETFSY